MLRAQGRKMNKKLNEYKAFIFDFNGTLLWDTELHNVAWDIFLKDHGIKFSDEEKNRLLHGKTNKDVFQLAFNKVFSTEDIYILSEQKESIYRRLVKETGISLADGVVDLFESCKKNKIQIAIATSSYKEDVNFFIEHFKLINWFEEKNIIFNDGTMKSKPHPDIFNYAIDIINIKKQDAVIFEDSYAGISAAERSMVGEIVIVNSMKENWNNSKHMVIDSFREINLTTSSS